MLSTIWGLARAAPFVHGWRSLRHWMLVFLFGVTRVAHQQEGCKFKYKRNPYTLLIKYAQEVERACKRIADRTF